MYIKSDTEAKEAVIQMQQIASEVWSYFFMSQVDTNKPCESVRYYIALEQKLQEARYKLDTIVQKLEQNELFHPDFSRWTEEGYQAEGRCLAMGESDRD